MNFNNKNNPKFLIKFNWCLCIISVIFVTIIHSCDNINEIPPRTEGTYNKKFQLPEPETLTYDERAYINNLQEEYDNNAN